MKCKNGWELDKKVRMCKREWLECDKKGDVIIPKTCKTKREWTSVLLGCSKYNCSGEIYEVE